MKSRIWSMLASILFGVTAALVVAQQPKTSEKKAKTATSAGARPAYPLKVSANGRYLVDRNNVPFLIAGDSPQALVSQLSEADADRYFANRRSYGFNAAGWINVVSARPTYPARADGSTHDGLRPFTGFLRGGKGIAHYDITKPNEAYFTRLDHIVRLAAKHDIVVFLDPMETIDWLPTLRNNGVDRCFAYGQFLGKRYKDSPNICWMNGNDFATWKNAADDAVVLAVARGIQSVDKGHIQTVELMVEPSTANPKWAPIISLNLAYTYGATYLQMLSCYNHKPTLPAFLGEAHYELEKVGQPQDFGTPSVVRRQAYWTMLSGGSGQFYGNLYTWTFKDGWKKNLDTPGAREFRYWKELFTALPWFDLAPDQDHKVVTAGLGNRGDRKTRVSQSDYCTAAMTPDGACAVAYLPTKRTITVNMARLKAPATAQWYDPTSGKYTTIDGSPLANRGSQQLTPPKKNSAGDEDWVLVLQTTGGRASGGKER
jgi:hypothetical protein